MSRGAGSIETRIADLFAATRHRALTIADVTDAAFALNGARPTRAQRLSATRAAHRLLRRHRAAHARHRELINNAHAKTEAALGRSRSDHVDNTYDAKLEADPAYRAAARLWPFIERIGIWTRWVAGDKRGSFHGETEYWQTTRIKKPLFFHPPDVPVQVWAVTIDRSGVHWFDCEVSKVTKRFVMARYGGDVARLDRLRLWYLWAFWRAVRFVSSRTGRIAAELDHEWWQQRFGSAGMPPSSMLMPLAEAMALLGVPSDYTKADVLAAFRRRAKEAHPDAGGTAEMFRRLVEARDRLLAAIGTSAPPPKSPQYAPRGARVIYRPQQPHNRLGSTTRLLDGNGSDSAPPPNEPSDVDNNADDVEALDDEDYDD